MYRAAFSFLILLSQAVVGALAATVTYDWEVTWVDAAPDGFARSVIGINGQWPCPPITANVGDTVVVNLKNGLGNQTTGLHFHGLRQINTNFMDGASMVSQCPVIPGLSIKYEFVVTEPGTYWYHSHNMGQYPDGLRGVLIVNDPQDPYCEDYDEEVIVTVTDWYHSLTLPLAQNMLLPSNTNFTPPIPESFLINEGKDFNIPFQVGKTYRVRVISFAALASFMINFDSHTMDVIMTDGSYVQKQVVDTLRVAPAQRYDFLLTSKKEDSGKNIPFLVAMDANRDFTVPGAVWPANQTGYLITDPSLPNQGVDVVDVFQPFDEGEYAPLNKKHALDPVTKTWVLDFSFCRDVNNYTR
jgi:iron transport multicopper oxidase